MVRSSHLLALNPLQIASLIDSFHMEQFVHADGRKTSFEFSSISKYRLYPLRKHVLVMSSRPIEWLYPVN